ncbi:MAG TPA: hypothetical protein VF250_00500 [Conexibacter sp.]
MRTRTILALLCGMAACAPAGASAATLRWPKPTLTNPITVQLGTGYTHTMLSTTRDYVVKLPSTKKYGGTWLEGGHNIVIVGGSVTIPASVTEATTPKRAAIYIKGATGTVHIQGVLIDGAGGAQMDGIDVDAPQATVQLQYDRIVNVRGGQNSWHGDVVQPFGGVKALRIDHLTGSSNFQGLFLNPTLGPIGSATLSNVNLVATTTATLDGGGAMLWTNNDPAVCTKYPVSLSNVWVQPRPGWSLAGAVWPHQLATYGACPGVTGGVYRGIPSTGSYVPAGSVGLGYTG